MALQHLVTPYFAKLITSSRTLAFQRQVFELVRKVKNRPHEVIFFYNPADPYSHLLLQKLQPLIKDFKISLQCKVILKQPSSMLPEPELLEQYAIKDAHLLAQACSLEFPENPTPPSQASKFLACQILLAQESREHFIFAALKIGKKIWQQDYQGLKDLVEEYGCAGKWQTEKYLKENEALLVKKGHYLAGTLYYGGEWYWGIDRLHFLVERLRDLGLANANTNIEQYIRPDLLKPHQEKSEHKLCPTALDFYFSFRSPYSYLALERTFSLAKQYPVKIKVKPVLPMVMRGLPVPPAKRFYILRDAKREARYNHIPFGKICDPLGKGVENCLAIYEFAIKENKEEDYLISVARGIWSEGINTASHSGLKKLVIRAGLNWEAAKSYLDNDQWKARAEQNRKEMFELGLWGVPSYQLGELTSWGQDRIWILQNELKYMIEENAENN